MKTVYIISLTCARPRMTPFSQSDFILAASPSSDMHCVTSTIKKIAKIHQGIQYASSSFCGTEKQTVNCIGLLKILIVLFYYLANVLLYNNHAIHCSVEMQYYICFVTWLRIYYTMSQNDSYVIIAVDTHQPLSSGAITIIWPVELNINVNAVTTETQKQHMLHVRMQFRYVY